MAWALRLLVFCGLGTVASPAAELERLAAIDDQWRYFRSPNFELYSRNDEKDSRELLHNLELLHAVFVDRFKLIERTRLDVTVYFFRTGADFRAYAPEALRANKDFKGFYLAGQDRAVISVAPVDDWDTAQRVVFHEFVHHLFRLTEQNPPVWFNEGMAEVLAGLRVEGDTLEIGRPHAGRVAVLREEKLLPLETLFAVDYDSPFYTATNHAGLFYAESWALLHYWFFGQSKLSPDAVSRFVRVASDRQAAAKVNLRAFFRECFAMDYPDMLRQLDRYITSGSYRFGRQPVPKIDAAASYPVRAVPRDETRVRLAELAVRVNRSSDGKLALLEAAEKQPPDPRVLEVLGADSLVERDETRTRERWEAALAAGSSNPAILRELALMESREWFEHFNYDYRMPAERAQRLRARLKQSIEREPMQSAAYEMLAWLEAYAEEPVYADINLVQRNFANLSHKDRTLLAFALVRVHAGLNDEAANFLSGIAALQPDAWTVQAAEVVRAKLEGRLVQRVDPSVAANATVVENTGASPQTLRVPSVELPARP